MAKPKVSIITATYNSASSLKRTIESVAHQDYPNIEYIVVDGGSTDETAKLLKQNQQVIAKSVSEPDRGISDAFNKGVRLATGDYINFQGAGDYFLAKDTISQMMNDINSKRDLLVCGQIKRIANDTNDTLFISSTNFQRWHLLYKMALPHQALFTHKNFFKRYGLFSLDCKFAMDYELLLRAYTEFPSVVMKNVVVSAWVDGGVGSNRIMEIFDEYNRIRKKNKIAPFWLLNLIDFVSRAKYQLFNLEK